MGITILQFIIWGGISSNIRSEIMFYSADASAKNKISDRISDDIPPQMRNLNTVIPYVSNTRVNRQEHVAQCRSIKIQHL